MVEALADGGFGDAEASGDLALGEVLVVEEVPGLEFAGGEGAHRRCGKLEVEMGVPERRAVSE